MLSLSERLFHDKLRKLAEELRDKHMQGAPTEIVASQLAYFAVMQVFGISGPALEVGDQRSQTLDTRDIATTLSLVAVHLLEGMSPEHQTASFQAVTRGIVNAFGRDEGHPLHPLYLKHFGTKHADSKSQG